MAHTDLLHILDVITAPKPQVKKLTREAVPRRPRSEAASLEAAALEAAGQLRRIIQSDNVLGAGIGDKISGGKRTGEEAVILYVKKKRRLQDLRGTEAVPPTADTALTGGKAVPFDVQELVPPRPEKNVTREPMQPGYSVGHVNVTAGTFGALVTRGKNYQILSNSHVLADSGKGKRGDQILYPGKHDGGKPPKDVAARLTAHTPFKKGGEFVNTVDAAIAAPLQSRLPDLRSEIKEVGVPSGIAKAERGMKVLKVGRTTGKTTGTVRDTNFRIKIDYGATVGVVGFRDQVLCTRYTEGGDSGSLVLDAKTKRAVGLHFAGAPAQGDIPGNSVFSPIDQVLKALRVKLVTKPIKSLEERGTTPRRGKPRRRKG